ncbi:TPA: ABC transporter ATP-binding protein [Candidatus Poribacteria bacterium]|nr:ABC transporter ATP-binding protein [Candidatus Poribacteria bacterium]
MHTYPKDKEVLSLIDLKTYFFTEEGVAKAVDGVSFEIHEGQTLALVGESGCGKTVTALSIMRLLSPPGKIVGGEIRFKGIDLLKLSPREMRRIRGKEIAMIFQDPMTSLNPVFTVGDQMVEMITLHRDIPKREARELAIEMLARVNIPDPHVRFDEYPHQMSGGMRQRVMIAIALSCDPKLIIADEPTTALDVTTQAQILELMRQLQKEYGMSLLFISHDLGVVAEIADRIAVMYASRIVEILPVEGLFHNPKHPYTLGLLRSRPEFVGKEGKLHTIPGFVPDPMDFPMGCRFHPRCPHAKDICRSKEPHIREIEEGHGVACWMYDG